MNPNFGEQRYVILKDTSNDADASLWTNETG